MNFSYYHCRRVVEGRQLLLLPRGSEHIMIDVLGPKYYTTNRLLGAHLDALG